MAQVKWSPLAVRELEAIYEYISVDSELYASNMVDRIISRADILESHVLIGRVVPEFGKPYIRELIEGSYRIVYLVEDEDNVAIVHIHHQSRMLNIL
ncbi:MAG: type II toxin-antitoxin system RelE/ParE family toxin [Chitinophagaceae bacterium]|nr:type II toxin-antitoxin system RelE/ParE family toxin [Chitinophagaceae bacterium]MCB9045773.1 type II toxin-antitoxin system RelE/ParE family toxin [Chitinophagales bacterium]